MSSNTKDRGKVATQARKEFRAARARARKGLSRVRTFHRMNGNGGVYEGAAVIDAEAAVSRLSGLFDYFDGVVNRIDECKR